MDLDLGALPVVEGNGEAVRDNQTSKPHHQSEGSGFFSPGNREVIGFL